MLSPSLPMPLPALRPLIGGSADSVEQLLNYGYRAAWKVAVGKHAFIVKADLRQGFTKREVDAQLHAGRSGVPVAEIVGLDDGPPAALAMRWLPGDSLHRESSAAEWRAAGEVLRRIHAQAPLRPREEHWSDFVLDWFARDVAYLGSRGDLTAGEADAALERARNLRPLLDAEPLAWLHGDCQAAHFLMAGVPGSESPRIVAVLDWADAQEGAVGMDFAVLTLFESDALPYVLDGYEADADLRQVLPALLPFYRALRAAGAAPWLDSHGYPRADWPQVTVRRFANQ